MNYEEMRKKYKEMEKSRLTAPDDKVPLTADIVRQFKSIEKTVEGTKHDIGKAPCELLSPSAMLGTAAVLAFGAKKYAPNNWRKGLAWMRISGAIMRHLFAFMEGEDLDKETGLPHVDHLGCEVMFLQELYRTRKDLDDRYKPSNNNDKEQ